MKRLQPVKKWLPGALLMLLSLLGTAFFLSSPKAATWWSVLPPIIAINLAFLTKNLWVSLGFAVYFGCYLLFGPVTGALTMGAHIYRAITDPVSLQTLGFVFFMLSMVQVITLAGGLHALVDHMKKYIVGPKSAQFMTALLGFFIFFDDYANTMIVGSTMRNICDKYKVSREKLAFLVDATAAPVAGIALVSTWVGYEVGLFNDMAGKYAFGKEGYAVFLDALSFRFYCFFMLFFVFTNVLFGRDFGPMKNTRSVKELTEDMIVGQRPLICATLPMGLLLGSVFGLLWFDGGGFAGKSILRMEDWRTVLSASKNSVGMLLLSSVVAWISAVVLALGVARVKLKALGHSLWEGVKSAGLPALILVLAWSLKAVCDELETGNFIVSVLSDKVNPVWLPLAIFIVAALTAFATGTSWGTMAILIPTVTPLAVNLNDGQYGVFVAVCLAAILDGAIMGDHCSPVSDTTIMSCISTRCDLISHVQTQMPYCLLVGGLALFVGYLPASLGLPWFFSFVAALFLMITLFYLLTWKDALRSKAAS